MASTRLQVASYKLQNSLPAAMRTIYNLRLLFVPIFPYYTHPAIGVNAPG